MAPPAPLRLLGEVRDALMSGAAGTTPTGLQGPPGAYRGTGRVDTPALRFAGDPSVVGTSKKRPDTRGPFGEDRKEEAWGRGGQRKKP